MNALHSMIGEMLPANCFYARKFSDIKLECVVSLDDFFACVPFTIKQELVDGQHVQPPYGINLTYPLDHYTRLSQTSGTTGAPLRWLDTPESWSWMVDNWVEVLHISGVTPEDRALFAFSFGPFLGFWTAYEAGLRFGCQCIPGGGMSSVARLRAILDNRVTVLFCTPTYAMRLGEVAHGENIDLARACVKHIITAGEPGACIPATRARLESVWHGARVSDQHGMTEVGPVTFECPEQPGTLHVIEHGFIPEVIDPKTGRHVGVGEQGELVLTNLGRVGSPLIRYRTGDLVERAATELCVCGRCDIALVGGILGRTDDMVIVRGVNVYPAAVEDIVRQFNDVVEYRVEVIDNSTMSELNIFIEPTAQCADTAGLAQSIELAFRTALSLRVPITIVEPGGLPRFELKAKRWVRVGDASG